MRLLIATLLTASLLAGQEVAKPAPEPSTDSYEAVIIPVKTLTGDAFNRMVRMLTVFGARIQADDKLRTIVVYAPPKVTEQIRKVVADLDKPGSPAAIGRNIDVTVSLIECGNEVAQALPAELAGVGKQLQDTMHCVNPKLWESVPLRLQEGREATGGVSVPGPTENLIFWQLNADSVGTKGAGSRYVRFTRVRISLGRGGDASIDTSGDFLESQKTVVGKLTKAGGRAMYAVISLKILD